jgi:hypothetical protein
MMEAPKKKRLSLWTYLKKHISSLSLSFTTDEEKIEEWKRWKNI